MKTLAVKQQIGWQVFQFWKFRDYWMRNGCCIELVEFRSVCADCGKPYLAKATQTSWRARQLARRCEIHRSAGKPVNDLKPPIKLSALPWWARPDRDKIKKTARKSARSKPTRRSAKSTVKRPEKIAGALNCSRRAGIAPDLSYLD
jgi:hypothetical protein